MDDLEGKPTIFGNTHIYESAEVIGLVEAEDLKPNDLVGVNKEPTNPWIPVKSINSDIWGFPIVVRGDQLMMTP